MIWAAIWLCFVAFCSFCWLLHDVKVCFNRIEALEANDARREPALKAACPDMMSGTRICSPNSVLPCPSMP